ncbi:MAG: hypothetical protein JWO52_2960 [Gammaproteobacteria bacterium]|nr:hypothetical protein [Gammaproteobacteria bacterium]
MGLPLSMLALSATATTWTVTDPTWELDGNSKIYASEAACVAAAQAMPAATYHCTSSHVATIVGAAGSGSVPPPPVPPPGSSGAQLWVYQNGTFYWPGDYSWGVKVNYKDTAGGPKSGPFDISVTGIGGFQPFATNYDLDVSPYKYLIFSLKPTIANQQWASAFYQIGDVATGVKLNVLNYGPAPVVGQWTTYKIPLGAGGYQIPAGLHIYKFMVQDQTADQSGSGYATNHWYVDDIHFSAN